MNHAFEFYKKEFAKHNDLADEYITKAYHTKSPFARAISLIWADKETIESLKALIMVNDVLGVSKENDFWREKINKIISKYPTERQVLLYES